MKLYGGELASEEPGRFSERDWDVHTERLWAHADQMVEVYAGLRESLDGLYAELSDCDVARLTLRERKVHAEREARYWGWHQQLLDVTAHVDDLFAILDKVDRGGATPEEIMAVLPQAFEAREPERRQSKRRRAIALQMQQSGAVSEAFDGVVTGSDPRRVASGRNRTHLRSSRGVSVYDAPGEFYSVTADTHGGKVRRPHRSGAVRIGRDGKRIRKS